MKLSSSVAALAVVLGVASLSSAQENQESHGSTPAPAPAPTGTYVAPPPVYAPGGGYGAPYQPAPPPMGPPRMKYSEGDPVPPGYRVETRTRTGLVVGGSIMFGVLYGLSAFGAAESDPGSDAKWLYLPVVGPFIYASTIDHEFAGVSRFFLYLDGLIQAGGATMMIIGLMGKTELVRNDIAKVSVMPLVGRANGLSLVGEF